MPIGIIAFPGSGISENLADKARKMGIPVQRITERAAGHEPASSGRRSGRT